MSARSNARTDAKPDDCGADAPADADAVIGADIGADCGAATPPHAAAASGGHTDAVCAASLGRAPTNRRAAATVRERWAEHSAKVVKVSPMKVIQNHHKMTEEELKVAEKQIEWLYSVAVEKIAENFATQCKLECRDATIRSLREVSQAC